MRALIEGHARFLQKIAHEIPWDTEEIVQGQNPEAVMLTCSDSRVVPGFFTRTGVGRIFVLRNAGNVAPVAGIGSSEEASIAYAVDVLRVPHLIVCGHTHCGAVAAAAAGTEGLDPSLRAWVGNIDLSAARSNTATAQVWANIQSQCARVSAYASVQRGLREERLRIHAWCYDIQTGRIYRHNPKSDTIAELLTGDAHEHT